MSSSKSIAGGPATPSVTTFGKAGAGRTVRIPLPKDLGNFFSTGNPARLGAFYKDSIEDLCNLLDVKKEELKEYLGRRDPDILHKAFSTGNPVVLREFVGWARAKFPENHYLLVLWGHAFGLGFGRDHGDPLTMPELAKALNRNSLEVPEDEKTVDIVGANACAMSYAEAAYELKDVADFIVAPQIAMPFAGWPYEAILNEMNRPEGISPKQLGERIIKLFMDSYENAFAPRNVALTLLNLEKADELKPRLATVVDALARIRDRNGVREPDRECVSGYRTRRRPSAHRSVRFVRQVEGNET